MARVEALEDAVTALAASHVGPADDDAGRDQPGPAPAWWKLTGPERQKQSPSSGPG